MNLAESTVYPLCAIRVPADGYACEAIALRYLDEQVTITSRGKLRFHDTGGDYRISFHPESGELSWGDTMMMHTAPHQRDGRVTGAGLDNAIGVLLGLLSARMLSEYSDIAAMRRRVIFAFTDQEEGPPIGLFGQGASRLAHALEPPRLGFINIDGHNIDEGQGPCHGCRRVTRLRLRLRTRLSRADGLSERGGVPGR